MTKYMSRKDLANLGITLARDPYCKEPTVWIEPAVEPFLPLLKGMTIKGSQVLNSQGGKFSVDHLHYLVEGEWEAFLGMSAAEAEVLEVEGWDRKKSAEMTAYIRGRQSRVEEPEDTSNRYGAWRRDEDL